MSGFISNFYAEWRVRNGVACVLHEDHPAPPERLLQALWYHQRLRRDELRATDGRHLRVLHPGFWNREAGPDFKSAMLQFDDDPPVTGDIEVDLYPGGWTGHQHHKNPAFRDVVLHVVWEGEGPPAIPGLCLKNHLDAPLPELATWLGTEAAKEFPRALAGHCSTALSAWPQNHLTDLLHQAALVRLQGKALSLQARARQAGWEQSLWEGLFRALGYKHNAWPMQRVAELRQRLHPAEGTDPPLALQARLLGIGGLLPAHLPLHSSIYVRRLWDVWWRHRDTYSDCALPSNLWRFSGMRPANHPQRRLALAAHWWSQPDWVGRLQKWCTAELKPGELVASLLREFQAGKDEYWSWHWTLRSPKLPKAQALIGSTRVTDLAINVVLPWLWIRAIEGKNGELQAKMEQRYLLWPSAEDNAVLRLARQRLLGTASTKPVRGAAAQQGLLQIVRDYCEHSNAVCADCRFPELLQRSPHCST